MEEKKEQKIIVDGNVEDINTDFGFKNNIPTLTNVLVLCSIDILLMSNK